MSTHFAVRYRLDGAERYFVWRPGEPDEVLLVVAQRLATFSTLQRVAEYLAERRLELDSDPPPFFDFDQLARWLAEAITDSINCETLLNHWNMLWDVSRSGEIPMHGTGGPSELYEKLFWCANIPGITPEGQTFVPTWNAAELAELSRVLASGLQNFRRLAAYAA